MNLVMNNYRSNIITSCDVITNSDLGKNQCMCLTWIWLTEMWCKNFGSDGEFYLNESESQLLDNSKDYYKDYNSVRFFFNSYSQISIKKDSEEHFFINDHFKDVLSESVVEVLNRIKTSVSKSNYKLKK